jgi:hypothetical protein
MNFQWRNRALVMAASHSHSAGAPLRSQQLSFG